MRRTFIAAAVLFAVAFVVGWAATPAEAAGGSGAGCYYTCDCSGTPLLCCPTSGGTVCTVTTKFQCPQIYNC